MSTRAVHVVGKGDTSEHHATSTSVDALSSLRDGHIYAKSLLIGLTSNNMAYATQGTRMHWWDAFTVPSDLPTPYNDQSLYGVVPCWGFGEVLESRVSGIEAGRLVWGFWPSSDMTVDLELKAAAEMEGHYIEVSEARSAMWNMYRRYMLADPSLSSRSLEDGSTLEKLARRANARAVWEGGYLISKAIFGEPPVHPVGSGEWTKETGDLSKAVVVSLSASGRTARSFADHIFNERQSATKPVAFLAITANASANVFRQPPIPTKIVSYADMTGKSTMDWIAAQKPKKIVVVDFGGRDNAFDSLFSPLEEAFPDIDVMSIGVGVDAKAHSAEDVGKFFQRNELPNRTMMNTTGIRDAMMARDGEAHYFAGVEKAWQGFLDRGSVDDMELKVGEGVTGPNGFETGWGDLCHGRLPVDGAIVYRL